MSIGVSWNKSVNKAFNRVTELFVVRGAQYMLLL